MSATGLKSTPGSSLNLADMPLPAEWILEGTPTAKGHVMIHPDCAQVALAPKRVPLTSVRICASRDGRRELAPIRGPSQK